MVKVDFSGVSDFTNLPAGEYDATLTEVRVFPAKAGKGPSYMFLYTVDDGEFEGKKQSNFYQLKEENLWALKRDAVALGAEPEDFTGEVDLDDVLLPLAGTSSRIIVTHKSSRDPNRPFVNVQPLADGEGGGWEAE